MVQESTYLQLEHLISGAAIFQTLSANAHLILLNISLLQVRKSNQYIISFIIQIFYSI